MSRRRRDSLLLAAQVREGFYALVRERAPQVFEDLAGAPFQTVLPLERLLADYYMSAAGKDEGERLTQSWLAGWCRRRQAGHTVPRSIEFRTANGGGFVSVWCMVEAAERELREWAVRWCLANAPGELPPWLLGLVLETLALWCWQPQAYTARALPPCRIVPVWNTDVLPRPRPVVPDPGEGGAAFEARQIQAVRDANDELVTRSLALRQRGGAERALAVLVDHTCGGKSWEEAADVADASRTRKQAMALARLLELA